MGSIPLLVFILAKTCAQSQRHHGLYKSAIKDDNEYAYHDGDPIRVHIFDARATIPSAEIRTLQNHHT